MVETFDVNFRLKLKILVEIFDVNVMRISSRRIFIKQELDLVIAGFGGRSSVEDPARGLAVDRDDAPDVDVDDDGVVALIVAVVLFELCD